MERVATYIRHEHGTTIQVYTGPRNQVAALRDLYLCAHRFSRVTFEQRTRDSTTHKSRSQTAAYANASGTRTNDADGG